jgi:hypothetical protein
MTIPNGSIDWPDTLAQWTLPQLRGLSLLAHIACSRSKVSLGKRRRKYMCAIGVVADAEIRRRGAVPPTAPFHLGDVEQTSS